MASFDGLRCKPLLVCALATGLMACRSLGLTKIYPSGDAKREDVPKEHRWSLEHLFGSYEEWEQLFTQLEGQLPELEPCRGPWLRRPAD